jgi:hypothetical protein
MGKKARRRRRKARKRNKAVRKLWLADMDRYENLVAAEMARGISGINVPDPLQNLAQVRVNGVDVMPCLLDRKAPAIETITRLIEKYEKEELQERQELSLMFNTDDLPPEAFAPPDTDEDMDVDCSEALRPTPSPEAFMPFVQAACDAVLQRLRLGGKRYGESVLFELGEMGAVAQCYTKAARALWSHQSGFREQHRDDTWLDLAGFAVLEIARKAHARNLHPDEIDGLFDRGIKKGTGK